MSPLSRRRFLGLSAGVGAAALAAPAASAALAPLPRSGGPRLKLALAAYSVRGLFAMDRGKANPKAPAGAAWDMFRFVDYCVEQGCDGAELTAYFLDADTDDYLLRLRRHAFVRGMTINGTAIGNNFTHADKARRDAEVAQAKRWIDRAAVLGAPHIRVFAGASSGLDEAELDRRVIPALAECAEYAGRRGVYLGLENHDSITTAARVMGLVAAVNHPWLGINLDSGNFTTTDPYADFDACVPHAVNVQVKVEIGTAKSGGKRPADLARLVRSLKAGGYQGWVVLEYEAAEDPLKAIPRHLKELRGLLA